VSQTTKREIQAQLIFFFGDNLSVEA